jgi:hypothetical protein
MFVYLIINSITGKYYVGQHKGDNLQHYLQQKFYEAEHRLKARSHLYASIRKHGRIAFSIHILSDVKTKEELDRLEKLFIILLDSRNPDIGYNICRGGEGFTGPHTEEARKKNSVASRAMWEQPGKRESIVSNMKKVTGACRVPGGKAGGRKAVESGQFDSIRPAAKAALKQWIKDHPEEHLASVRKGGRKNVENGNIARMRSKLTLEKLAEGGRIASCKRWNIDRGKHCVCGQHLLRLVP